MSKLMKIGEWIDAGKVPHKRRAFVCEREEEKNHMYNYVVEILGPENLFSIVEWLRQNTEHNASMSYSNHTNNKVALFESYQDALMYLLKWG